MEEIAHELHGQRLGDLAVLAHAGASGPKGTGVHGKIREDGARDHQGDRHHLVDGVSVHRLLIEITAAMAAIARVRTTSTFVITSPADVVARSGGGASASCPPEFPALLWSSSGPRRRGSSASRGKPGALT